MVESDTASGAAAVRLIAELAAGVAGEPTLQELLDRAIGLAIDIVPGCEQAGISLLHHKTVHTPASIGPLASACDKLQERLGDGPCVRALLDAEVIRIDDVTGDDRWPDFAKGAAALGLGSMLACRLATQRDKLGAMNLYSSEPAAFDELSERLAIGYAAHVGLALAAFDREANLRRALQSREVIGQAMGILMERHRITATQAFDVMVQASQRTNIKLRIVADQLVQTGLLPTGG